MGPILAKTATHVAHRVGWLDVRTGLTMLKSSDIRTSLKIAALAFGVLATAILALFEFPLESAVALMLPFVGATIDLLVDGAEVVLAPILFAAMILPHLARRSLR